jgi:hypothetical protein
LNLSSIIITSYSKESLAILIVSEILEAITLLLEIKFVEEQPIINNNKIKIRFFT